MTPLRAAACSLLPQIRGVFLRCDRGGALYVANTPARTDQAIDWSAAGFHAREERGLVFLTPQDVWIERLHAWAARQVNADQATEHLSRACFGAVEEADRALLIEGVKRLELGDPTEAYDRMVRQRAAVCLRKRQGGGTLAVCALMAQMMRENDQSK